ncbi:hypothetical protein ALI144C_41755 [Actinosynnema sp. ALI-1.44]|uniref:hypothetical protein n=1 Tax=Actinosynnema sp. ALI-1.44 TaxID=1933779 RepID=UPI00097C042A|nr:hypothetical protein [Actinosynnema sp. ALI-1.44]ONI75260.1 hypothetical protein ALI144C_41755 [Actinosynnema sp. ALI-1.44]
MPRRLLLLIVGAAAVCLVPWTIYLAGVLPDHHRVGEWRLAWVGFDIALLCCFAVALWLGLRRRRAAVPVLAATAAMLLCDAWFDVVFDWSSHDRWSSVVMAVCAEVPMAVVLLWQAKVLLNGGMPSRRLTARDVEMNNAGSYRELSRALSDNGPTSADTLATVLGMPGDDVAAKLTALAQAGHARQGRDGRWRTTPLNLLQPDPAETDDQMAAYLEQKYQNELRLLTWAVRNRTEFGAWATGSRAVLHLSEADLARFTAEYDELLTRYCLLHNKPEPDTRELALRFYGFPFPRELPDLPDG